MRPATNSIPGRQSPTTWDATSERSRDGSAALVAGAFATRWVVARGGPIELGAIVAARGDVAGRDSDGAIAWVFIPASTIPESVGALTWSAVADLDGRAGSEVVVAPPAFPEQPEFLYVLGNDGRERWRRAFEESFTFGRQVRTAVAYGWRHDLHG